MRGLSALSSLTALGFLAFLPNMGAWGASTFSESVVFIILWFTLPWQLDPKVSPLKKGVLAALPLAFRYQMGAWLVAFAPFAVVRTPRALLLFGAGAALPLLAVGLLDWGTWGSLFHTLIYQVRLNALEGASAMNGVSPWYAFGPLVLTNFGPWALAALLLPVIGATALRRLHWKAMDAQILVPALFFCVVHMAIGHKETRFLLPEFPALFYLLALGLDALQLPWMTVPPFWRAVPTVALALTLSVAAVISPRHYERGSLGQLTGAGQRWLDAHPTAPPRVALLSHYWIWTRGEMGLGRAIDHKDMPLNEVSAEKLRHTSLAFLFSQSVPSFALRAEPWGWHLQATDEFGNGLFVNERSTP
jgi:hypothetical protein